MHVRGDTNSTHQLNQAFFHTANGPYLKVNIWQSSVSLERNYRWKSDTNQRYALQIKTSFTLCHCRTLCVLLCPYSYTLPSFITRLNKFAQHRWSSVDYPATPQKGHRWHHNFSIVDIFFPFQTFEILKRKEVIYFYRRQCPQMHCSILKWPQNSNLYDKCRRFIRYLYSNTRLEQQE